jgi:hypothetical protein
MTAKQVAGIPATQETATSRALSKALSDAKLEAEVAGQQNHVELTVEKQRLESKLALRESSQVRGWLEDMQLSKVCAVFSLQFCTRCYRDSRLACTRLIPRATPVLGQLRHYRLRHAAGCPAPRWDTAADPARRVRRPRCAPARKGHRGATPQCSFRRPPATSHAEAAPTHT